jgi:hypothetical protein
MGACCTTSKTERELEFSKSREIGKLFFLFLVNSLKSNKKLYATLIRIQSRLRGLISRKKTRAMIVNSHTRFVPNESNAKYFPSDSMKIVTIYLINF